MSSGFQYHATCFSSMAEVQDAVLMEYPIYLAQQVLYIRSSSVPKSFGDVVYWTATNSTTNTDQGYYVVLLRCDTSTFASSPFTMSPYDGALIASAIVAVWATAWAFKALFMAVGGSTRHNSETD